MVSVLDIKLLRDLRNMWPQVLSIALLIASGTAVLVMSVSNYLALVAAMDGHYRSERFAEVFASLKRAPNSLVERVREVDGIGIIEPRVAQTVRVIRQDADMPLSGRIVSIPATGQPLLNRLHLVDGRWIEPGRNDEVIINAAYGRARAVRPGDKINVILNGRFQAFHVVGLALSPEFVFATRSALPLPDDRNFVVMWASQDAVAGAFDMRGAFNDLVMTLAPGARIEEVIANVDGLLAPYGAIGAYGRREQPSHRFLEDELAEQETMSVAMPVVFFGIAAFLLNIVLGRLVAAQREQIASLRALGYPTAPILFHYFKLVSVIAAIGGVIGLALGYWLAFLVIESYRTFFRFPELEAQLEPWVSVLAVIACLVAANAAAAIAVARIARQSPAEAMRTQVPAAAGTLLSLRIMKPFNLSIKATITLRNIIGRPLRTLLTIAGIALSVPLVLFGLFWFDAIAFMLDTSFERIERGDAVVTFTTPVPARAANELRSIPGILLAEGQRSVPVRLVAGHRSYRTSLNGIAANSELKIMRRHDLTPIMPPVAGVMLTRQLAERLHIKVGDEITVEVLEGLRLVRSITVERLSDDILGLSATIEIGALNRMLGEGEVINAAALKFDGMLAAATWQTIARTPKIEASSAKALWLSLFNETIAAIIMIGALVLAGFGLLITFGVVYNSARVALYERAWELASLRILGFSRGEVSFILLSELAITVAVAVPIGLAFGRWLIGVIIALRARESFQVPPIIEPQSYAIAALVVLAAAGISAYVVRRRIDTLDLVATLKTRD